MYKKIFKKILELSKAGYELSIHADNLGYVLSIRNRTGEKYSHIISYDEIEIASVDIELACLGAYSLFIRELNAMMDHMGINDIERLDPDLHWEFDPLTYLAYDDINRNNIEIMNS